MICLIEGPDGAGKSTLASALRAWAEKSGSSVLAKHTGAPEPPSLCPFTEYEASLDDPSVSLWARSQGRLLIFDRYHTGEAVYGPVFRDGSRLTMNGLYHCELALDALGAVKIAVLPPLEVIEKRLAGRPSCSEYDRVMLFAGNHLAYAREWYQAYAVIHGYRIWDGRQASATDLAELLSVMSQKAENAEAASRLSGSSYIGSLKPEVLLCGDVRGAGRHGRPDLIRPFTPTRRGGGSNYLLHALQLTRLSQSCGIVNANEPSLPVNVRGLWRVLGEPAVVALGERASKTLRDLDLEHRKISHPQWANRFRHREQAWYATEIEKAAAG